MLSADMYRENILDHFKNPRNYGVMDNATITMRDSNPLCGDVIEMHLLVENGTIADVRFHGHGCAISQSTASMLTEKIKGKNVTLLKDMTKQDVLDLLGIDVSPVRQKCAFLPLKVAKLCAFSATGERYEE